MQLPIKNTTELRSEIYRLEGLERQQAVALKARFSSPAAVFSTVLSIFPKSEDNKSGGLANKLFHQDFIGLISRLVLPIALNRTLFKKSGFLVKTLVGILSQKASNYINEDSVSSVWHKVKEAFDENVAHNSTVTGIADKIKNLFSSKKIKPRLKKAPVPDYVKASS